MSALPQRIFVTPKPVKWRPRRAGKKDGVQRGFVQPLLQTMIQTRTMAGGRGVFAFTGPASGVGVTHVVQFVAHELAIESGGRVLIASAPLLEGASPDDLRRAPRGYVRRAQNVWSLLDDAHAGFVPDALLDHVWVDMAPEHFDFVLIDCPALNETGDALRLGPEVDGLFLVVAAGKTRRDQIEHAQKMLAYSCDRYRGLVLNQRTYPVPNFLYRFL